MRRHGLGVNRGAAAVGKKNRKEVEVKSHDDDAVDKSKVQFQSIEEQIKWFSSIHQMLLPDDAMVELNEKDHSIGNLIQHIKGLAKSWKQDLCSISSTGADGCSVQPGSPSVLIISSSAVRCVDLLRGLSSLTKECKPAKLFAKHLKIDEQVTALKQRVNIAAGTPNRIKKLIELEALQVSRLTILLLDMHRDAKRWNLLTAPELRTEFWSLYKDHLHSAVLEGRCRICLY